MAHTRTFFERFGCQGICVLPAEVLDNTPLTDPQTGLRLPNLRERCSQQGQLCYAQVLSCVVEGLYWADVAASPDLADAERIVLCENHLIYALAWDKRLKWRTPAQMRCLMQAQARDLAPLRPSPESESPVDLLSVPEMPLAVVATVEGSTADELRGALDTEGSNYPPKVSQRHVTGPYMKRHPARVSFPLFL